MAEPRRRRRAVGPAGSQQAEPDVVPVEPPAAPESDEERLRAERPPHHDQGV